MPLPLPKVLYDVGPGGRFITAAKGGNALANDMATRRYNEAKAEYAPESLLAQAASQTAYANNVGPQYIAKILQDAGFKGNTSDPVLKELVNRVQNAGLNNNPMINALNIRLAQRYGNQGQQHQNPLTWLWHQLTNKLNPQQQQNGNPFANLGQQPMPQQSSNVFNQQQPMPQAQPTPVAQNQGQSFAQAQGSAVDENGNAVDEKGNRVPEPTPDELQSLDNQNKGLNPDGSPASVPLNLEVNTGQKEPKPVPSYGENEAAYIRQQEQGKALGGVAGKMQGEIAQRLDTLAATGGSIDRLIEEFTNPELINLRNEFPYLQDMQIEAASHLKDPRIQNMIGQIKTDIEQFKGATVMGFGGQTLKREFEYADKLKPSLNDTVYTATGKLQTLKILHDVAEKKARLIDQYLKNKNMTPAEAVSKANKMVDVSSIEKRVKELTAPTVEIENPETHQSMFITTKRAKELGITKEQAKRYGMKYD